MATADYYNRIVAADCVELLTQFDPDSVDLIVTSPPYDNLRNYKGYQFPFEEIADALVRVLKPGAVLVWVVSDATIGGSETGTSFKQALFFMSLGLNLHDTMIFRKRNPVPQIYRKRYSNEFEYMFVFSKGPIRTHHPIMVDCLHAGLELGSTTYKNYSRHEQVRGKFANPVRDQKIKGNVWEYVVGKSKDDLDAKGHPAPFPCQLARDHIASWSSEGDVVLDPMCGSGTTCKVAQELGRVYIGIDIAEQYVQLAKERLQQSGTAQAQVIPAPAP